MSNTNTLPLWMKTATLAAPGIGSNDPFGFSWRWAVSLRKLPIMGVGFPWISGGTSTAHTKHKAKLPIARTAHRLPARPAGWAPLRHERRCRPARHGCRSRPGTLIPSRGGVAERDGALTPRHRVDARGRKASAGFGGPRSNRASACVPMSAAKPLAAISPSASGPHPESPVVINPRHDLPFIRAP